MGSATCSTLKAGRKVDPQQPAYAAAMAEVVQEALEVQKQFDPALKTQGAPFNANRD